MTNETINKTWAVALTGGIASGKSAVGRAFAARGVPVHDADLAARELVVPGTAGLAAIVETFGKDVLDAEGRLDRRALRERAFASTEVRHRLEAILHPRIDAWLRERASADADPYAVLVIPLLAETWPQYEWVNRVALVTAATETQIARLVARDGISEAAAQRVLDAQASDKARRALADDIIENDRDLASLDAAVERLHQHYLALARTAQ